MINDYSLTVITPNYNGETYIEETIQSVINQSDKDFEYLVFDANSNDNSKKLIEKYKNNISFIRYKEDNGVYDAVDQAIKISKGNIILWINSDDLLHIDEENFQKILNIIKTLIGFMECLYQKRS